MPIKRDSSGRFSSNGGGSRKPAGRASRVNKANQAIGKLQGAAKASIAASKTADGKFNLTPKAKTQLKQASAQMKIVNKDAGKRMAKEKAAKARNAPKAPLNDAQKAAQFKPKQTFQAPNKMPADKLAAMRKAAVAETAKRKAESFGGRLDALALAKKGADHATAKRKPTKAQARAAALKIAQAKMLAAANKKKK